MARGVLPAFRGTLAALQPPPQLVDWSLFAIVVFEATSGLVSFTVADPGWWPLFWAHRIAGLTLIPLLGFKLVHVRDRLTDSAEWRPSTVLSGLTLIAALGALGTGIAWAVGLDVRLWYWTLLSVHVGFGL
ncbi:MAG: sulfite oxidase, partial [Haloarculaceae archaeon]